MIDVPFSSCHISSTIFQLKLFLFDLMKAAWRVQPHPKIRVLHLRETYVHASKRRKALLALLQWRMISRIVRLMVGEDYGPGALHDGDKNCRTDDEALDLDDSWLMHENEDSNGIATLMVVAMEVMRDGCHGSLHGDFALSLWRRWRFGGLKVEEDGDVTVVRCHLNTVVHT
ncbi:hypothetical protein V8G54_007775 [Vigna mungo]|uniref:Uncharacterized protein n=1 Tax=Vigna mungo TaxID=3915 RepID=A0AAQ3P624_VIGMU